MRTYPDYLKEAFNTQQEQWEKQLQSELKIEDVSTKTHKKIDGQKWPILSLQTPYLPSIPVSQTWKKASQTFAIIPENIKEILNEDLASGVRTFFLHSEFLNQSNWHEIEKVFKSFPKRDECEIFFIGPNAIETSIPVIEDANLSHGREVEYLGGSTIQELALMTKTLVKNLKDNPVFYIGVHVDSQFFKNIAKIRAAKLLAYKVLETSEIKAHVHIVALSSYQEWTLFERYSNILRNDIAVASAMIAGADSIQSSGYQIIFELELDKTSSGRMEKSLGIARNTSHVLALESMLGVVGDPAHGSYHLETLTQHFAKSAWELFQNLNRDEILKAASEFSRSRWDDLKTRRKVLVGINDFPDVKEALNIKPRSKFFRLARPFEELRLLMETVEEKPKVHIALYGDYASLSARVNFIKNYFELLGLTVSDPTHNSHDLDTFIDDVEDRKEEIIVLCASDDKYPELAPRVSGLKSKEKFLAGKVEIPGFIPIFSGQDIYSVLGPLVKRWTQP